LGLLPTRLKPFKCGYPQYAVIAEIRENQMLLLSRESPLKMSAELFPYENAQIQDNSFALLNEFTQYHQIDCVFEDQHKQQAIFVTQSYHTDHAVVNRLIDKVTVFKLVLGADAKLV
jgi:hypothetical protein